MNLERSGELDETYVEEMYSVHNAERKMSGRSFDSGRSRDPLIAPGFRV
jgi:hypothetical protein